MNEPPKQDPLLKPPGMTTSASDNEALMAIRRANELLARAGWTWEMLLKNKIKIIENAFNGISNPRSKNFDPPKPPPPPRQPDQWGFTDGAVTKPVRPQMGPQNAGPLPRSSTRPRGKYRPLAGEL